MARTVPRELCTSLTSGWSHWMLALLEHCSPSCSHQLLPAFQLTRPPMGVLPVSPLQKNTLQEHPYVTTITLTHCLACAPVGTPRFCGGDQLACLVHSAILCICSHVYHRKVWYLVPTEERLSIFTKENSYLLRIKIW